MQSGGVVNLTIIDVRTGLLAYRQAYVGGIGPITPHYYGPGYGPVTAKSVVGPHPHAGQHNVAKTIKHVVKMFND
jgi:hypothetical protein